MYARNYKTNVCVEFKRKKKLDGNKIRIVVPY